MPVDIRGKPYKLIAERVNAFREDHPDGVIATERMESEDGLVSFRSVIGTPAQPLLASGHAEEVRGSTNINKTSALENCETSAVGRALAFAGYAGTEIASADEVANAINQQAGMEHIEYMNLVREHWDSIADAKELLIPIYGENEDQANVSGAREVLKELGEEVYVKLWKAPTKGGVFTTKERQTLKVKPEDAL